MAPLKFLHKVLHGGEMHILLVIDVMASYYMFSNQIRVLKQEKGL